MMHPVRLIRWIFVGCMVLFVSRVTSFAPSSVVVRSQLGFNHALFPSRSVTLYASTDKESSSDQGVLGAIGSVAALITLYSEFTLANTGCGLPAGPLGLVGLAEGLSYLGIVGIVGYSLFTKVKAWEVRNCETNARSRILFPYFSLIEHLWLDQYREAAYLLDQLAYWVRLRAYHT